MSCSLATTRIGVSVVDDLSTWYRSNLEGLQGVRFYEGSVLDPSVRDEALNGADAVVHLAAVPSVPRSITDPLRSNAANNTGTLEVLEAARRAGDLHTIVAFSSSVYGANATLPKLERLRAEPMSALRGGPPCLHRRSAPRSSSPRGG